MIHILIVNHTFSDHVVRFITHLKRATSDIVIDFLAPKEAGEPPLRIQELVRTFYTYDDVPKKGFFRRLFLRYRLHNVISLRRVVVSLAKDNKYDSITIHYPMWHYLSIIDILKRMTENILLFPWGSDVYRATWYEKLGLRRLYRKAKYIGSQNNRFRKDFCRILKVEKSKLVDLNIGSDLVDFIRLNKSALSKEKAKETLGVQGKYVITCGYNNQPSQRHCEMIDAINFVRGKLLKDIVLFFPVTYGGSKQYTENLIKKARECRIDSRFFVKYLPESEYFTLMRATDLFIHVQTTDADSGSVKEFILSGAKVLNGSWLKYDDLLMYKPLPYFEVKDMNSLGDDIINAVEAEPIDINPKTYEILYEFGWEYAIKAWKQFYESIQKN